MGVHGLWKLLEPAGKPIPLETLENKVLAVDVSIWLYQLTKGFKTSTEGSVPNAHLVGLFNRICKLLYYRIKPVFVFDGGVPQLKKDTVEERKRRKRQAIESSEEVRDKLVENLLRQSALKELSGQSSKTDNPSISATTSSADDMFILPPLPTTLSSDEEVDEEFTLARVESLCQSMYGSDLSSVDINSEEFKALPANVRHEILCELAGTRKQSSWAKVHEMPEESGEFSDFQLGRLLKRHQVQVSLEETAKEMSVPDMPFPELEEMLKQKGIIPESLIETRIASDDVTRYIYVTGNKTEECKKILKQHKFVPTTSNRQIVPRRDINAPGPSKRRALSKSSSEDEEDTSSQRAVEILSDEDIEAVSQEDIMNIIKNQNAKGEKVDSGTEASRSMDQMDEARPEMYEALVSSSAAVIASEQEELSQEQILELIRQQNIQEADNLYDLLKLSNPDVSHTAESGQISAELHANSNSTNEGTTSIQEMSIQKSGNETSDSSSEGFIEVTEPKSDSGTSSDDSDFIEVEEAAESSYFKNERLKPDQNLEITFTPPAVIENDIFSDIFADSVKKDQSFTEGKKAKTAIKDKSKKAVSRKGQSLQGQITDQMRVSKSQKSYTPRTVNSPSPVEVSREAECSVAQKDLRGASSDTKCSVKRDMGKEDKVMANIPKKARYDVVKVPKSDISSAMSAKTLSEARESSANENVDATVFESTEETNNVKISQNVTNTIEECSGISGIHREVMSSENVTEVLKIASDASFTKRSAPGDDSDLPKITGIGKVISPKLPQLSSEGSAAAEPCKMSSKDEHSTPVYSNIQSGEVTVPVTEQQWPGTGTENNQTPENLRKMQNSLSEVERTLLEQQGKMERLGSTVTQHMILEVQELLQLFGLPYIVAPMEAEAQCAFLDNISLTEGTITDDSDIWLFGGQKVYKNFFDNRKFVLHFRAVDIESLFKLTREQMIKLAMLVGSDYTIGIEGVGPVTAMEIIAFLSDKAAGISQDVTKSLQNFRIWLDTNKNSATPLARKLKDVAVSEDFPNGAVVDAYMHPTVDESRERFSWALPNLDKLKEYTKKKFGWKPNRVDDILQPVMRRLHNRNQQGTLDAWVRTTSYVNDVELPFMSKRVQKAVCKLRNMPSTSGINEPTPKDQNKKQRQRGKIKGEPSTSAKNEEQTTKRIKTYPSNVLTKTKEFIPQRERDKAEVQKRRAHAASILKSKAKNAASEKRKSTPEIKSPDLSEASSGED